MAGSGFHPGQNVRPERVAVARGIDSTSDLARKSVQVDKLLVLWNKRNSPEAAVIVIRDGQTLHSKGYGLANRKTQQPLRPDTPSLIGSVSEQFTAIAVMMILSE
jgi:CubicO group peptidase (beta-lactamase class C family)